MINTKSYTKEWKLIPLFMILGLFLISFTSAMCPTDSTELTGSPFKTGTQIELKQICDSCSYVTLSSISYPDSSSIYINENMTKSGTDYNYSFINTSIVGTYGYSVLGDKDGTPTTVQFCFEVNPSGTTFDNSTSILSIFILAIIIGLLVFSTKALFKAEEGGWQIFYICISYILLFSVFFLFWIFSKNYLYDIPILSSVFWVIWLILSVMFFPFIIIVSAYILKQQAEAMLEGDYVKQGYTRSEAQEMSKKHKR